MEGLVNKTKDWFKKANPFSYGDNITKHHPGADNKEDNSRGGGADFVPPSSTLSLYRRLLDGLHDMSDRKDLPFTIIIYDNLSKSFVGPVPTNSSALLLRAERRKFRTAAIPMLERGWGWRITIGFTRIWG